MVTGVHSERAGWEGRCGVLISGVQLPFMYAWLSVSWPGVWRPPARCRRRWLGPCSSRPGCDWPPAAGGGSPAEQSRVKASFCWAEQLAAADRYLLVVVRCQQEQQREGKSDVGALGHVLVGHFPLRDRKSVRTEHSYRNKSRGRCGFRRRVSRLG